MAPGKDYIGVSVAALILNDTQEVLLQLRRKPPEQGCWGIPGGKVQLQEPIESALRRELQEELGVRIDVLRLLCVVDHIVADEEVHWLVPIFLANLIDQTPVNLDTNGTAAIRWYDVHNLPPNLTIPTVKALERYLSAG